MGARWAACIGARAAQRDLYATCICDALRAVPRVRASMAPREGSRGGTACADVRTRATRHQCHTHEAPRRIHTHRDVQPHREREGARRCENRRPSTLLTQGRPRRRDSRHHTAVQGPRFLREKPAVVHGTRRVCTVSIVKNMTNTLCTKTVTNTLCTKTDRSWLRNPKATCVPPKCPIESSPYACLLLSNGREADRSLTSSLRRQSVCRCTARQSRRRLSTAPRWRPSRLLAPPPMPVAHSRREAAVRPLQRLSPIVQQRRTAFCASARAAATTRNLAPHPLL